jgi:D-sedoheptulose 7-phosphate isomerase
LFRIGDVNYSESESLVLEAVRKHEAVVREVAGAHVASVVAFAELVAGCLEADGTVFWCGNGGSAADAQHLSGELVGRFESDRRPLRSVALSADGVVLTCIGNDFGYDEIFARQVTALGRPGDVLVGISTSGHSPNVSGALEAASEAGLSTVGLLGRDGGAAVHLVDLPIVVSGQSTARIQEAHTLIGHVVCDLVERLLGID